MNITNKIRYRQELLIMGLAWGKVLVNKFKYLGVSRAVVYNGHNGQLRLMPFLFSRVGRTIRLQCGSSKC